MNTLKLVARFVPLGTARNRPAVGDVDPTFLERYFRIYRTYVRYSTVEYGGCITYGTSYVVSVDDTECCFASVSIPYSTYCTDKRSSQTAMQLHDL